MTTLADEEDYPHHADALDTIPEDRPSNEWIPGNVGLQRWWHVMTRATSPSRSSSAGSGGNNNGTSIPSDEAEIVDREVGPTIVAQQQAVPPVSASQTRRQRQCCSRRTNVSLVLIAMVVALMVGAGVGIFFIVESTNNVKGGGGYPTDSSTAEPPADIPTPPVEPSSDEGYQTEADKAEIASFLISISGDSLDDDNSPQSMARTWLLENDPANVSIRVHGEERVTQRYVLSVFYYAMNGSLWEIDNFLTSSHECDWYGVTCNDVNVDLVLELPSISMTGSIPRECGELSLLEKIILRNNSISGDIPNELFGLPFLYIIDFSDNQITGRISQSVYDLPFLEFLYLSSNKLSGSLPDLPDSVPPLKHLRLHGNDLTGRIPPSLSKLSDLETLVVYDNNFNSSLDFDDWSEVSKLYYIDASWNALSGSLPRGMSSATSLQYIYLNNNTLTGSLNQDLGELRQLNELWLHANTLSGQIPASWGDLKSLSTLLLYDNILNGTVPESICNLTLTGNVTDGGGNLTVFETDCEDAIDCPCCTACH